MLYYGIMFYVCVESRQLHLNLILSASFKKKNIKNVFILLSYIFSLTCLSPSPPPPPPLSLSPALHSTNHPPIFVIHIAQHCTSLSTARAHLLSSGILRIGQQDSA